LGGDVVTGYFDLANEVSKMAQMPVASLMFQKHFVRPAERLVRVSYDEPRTYDSLKEKRWIASTSISTANYRRSAAAGASVSSGTVRRASHDPRRRP